MVAAYRAEHPEASVTEVARALNISRTTVYKWWDGEAKQQPAKPKSTARLKQQPAADLDNITPERAEDFATKLVQSIMSLPLEDREKLLDEIIGKSEEKQPF